MKCRKKIVGARFSESRERNSNCVHVLVNRAHSLFFSCMSCAGLRTHVMGYEKIFL